MPAFRGFQSHIGSHGQSRHGQDCTPGHHAAWSWVTFMLLSGCGYATLIGSAAFWRVGVYSFSLSQSIWFHLYSYLQGVSWSPLANQVDKSLLVDGPSDICESVNYISEFPDPQNFRMMGIPSRLRFPEQQRWEHRARPHSTFLRPCRLSREAEWRQLLWLFWLWSFQQRNYSWQPLCTGIERTRENTNGAQFYFEMGNGDSETLSICWPLMSRNRERSPPSLAGWAAFRAAGSP